MESFGIASVAGITVICYLMGLIVKNLPLNNKWIPSGAGWVGGRWGGVGCWAWRDGDLCRTFPQEMCGRRCLWVLSPVLQPQASMRPGAS